MRKLLFFGAVFLVLSLACAEIPELLTICDNSSNDFTVNPASWRGSASQSPLMSAPSALPTDGNSGIGFSHFRLAMDLQVLPLAGKDLLILLSLQRK